MSHPIQEFQTQKCNLDYSSNPIIGVSAVQSTLNLIKLNNLFYLLKPGIIEDMTIDNKLMYTVLDPI